MWRVRGSRRSSLAGVGLQYGLVSILAVPRLSKVWSFDVCSRRFNDSGSDDSRAVVEVICGLYYGYRVSKCGE